MHEGFGAGQSGAVPMHEELAAWPPPHWIRWAL
jgi:hypothetical protein